ncbi:unnamed protein product, partial [Cyprideis torosa]
FVVVIFSQVMVQAVRVRSFLSSQLFRAATVRHAKLSSSSQVISITPAKERNNKFDALKYIDPALLKQWDKFQIQSAKKVIFRDTEQWQADICPKDTSISEKLQS